MTTENQQLEQSTTSSSIADVESSSKMQGWFKLVETYRKSEQSSNKSIRSSSNRYLNNNNTSSKQQKSFENFFPMTTNTNGYTLTSSETNNTLDSPPNIFNSPSIISLDSTPRQTIEEISLIDLEPISSPRLIRDNIPIIDMESTTGTTQSPSSSSSRSTDSKRSPKRSKKITIRKSNNSKKSTIQSRNISTPVTEDISDDDIPLVDIRKQKTKSLDVLAIPPIPDSMIPLATDLLTLPGHIQDETRDIRFLSYIDTDTLANHFNTCLYIDKKSFSSKQYIFKSRYNALNNIFKFYFIKTFRPKLVLEKKSFNKKDNQKSQPLSVISSPTATSFKIDWSVNRRQPTSIQRQKPKNPFHILQVQPKDRFSPTNQTLIPTSKSPKQTFERVKDILARTYYPHLYTAVEYGYQFGIKSKIPNTQQLISTHDEITTPIKEMPESPNLFDDSITITLKSPPSSVKLNSTVNQSPSIITQSKSLSSITIEYQTTEETKDLSSIVIKPSFVVLTPTRLPTPSPPLIDHEKKLNNIRKRKSSTTINTNIIERKKKRIISSPSIEIINHIENISDPESEEEVIPSILPKQSFIKNGLRSNYYKTPIDNNSKSISNKRRRRQSSGSLPSFYTGIFESDDDKSPHIDYCLPYDIYWHGQQKAKQTPGINTSPPPPPFSTPLPPLSSSITTFQHKKKKSTKPKQKQPSPYKKICRNIYSDQLRQTLLSSYSIEKAPVCDCKPTETCEDGECMNKIIYTECLPTCVCGSKCSNQKIRKAQWYKNLEVFDTGKYGQGLRTTTSISKGTFLCEYVGEIITDEKFHERMTNLYSKDEHHYTMKLTQNLVIDAYRMGSIARFANHSCAPNCEFQKWTVDGLQRMCMFSKHSIKAGEEITYDYNFQCFNSQAQQPCYCESSKCRGIIGAKQPTTTMNCNNNHNNHSMTIQRLSQREKRTILQSSIFLLRNLRKIKQKQEFKKSKKNKNSIQQRDKQSAISLFFTQNYYHPTGTNHKTTLASLRKTPKSNHKDMFYLFYNHIRRSHFAKSGRYQYEIIDDQCYYAQLAQLTLILIEIFELILNYRCLNIDMIPSNLLKKCPSKRLFPAYYEIITKPIDLTIIRNKLDTGEYLSYYLFEEDFSLLFQNAVTYCGRDSDEARAVLELEDYFLHTLKIEYQSKLNLFIQMKEENRNLTNLNTFENFITYLHEKEVRDGQIRETLYDMIYNIDDKSIKNSPICYKIVLANTNNSHRPTRNRASGDFIVHCRCGSVYDENSLVQCYACQLWQHVACVSIVDPSRPYYCFECQPTCENNPLACLKTNVLITATLSPLQTYDDNHSSYSTLTRSDGFIIRINECYFVPKQDKNNIDRALTSPEYDILYIERLWIDDYGVGQASGFYYIRPNETFHEPTRKFFPNEVFRFPSSNDPLPISSIVRPCFVLDIRHYCKGKPISDNSTRVLSSDIFICEYRVDKLARTFTRLVKSRQSGINSKSYCFDNYVEKLPIKREYQPYQKELQQNHHDNRRRSTISPTKLNNKQFQEKKSRINGFIEKIYCCSHHQTMKPNDTKYTINQLLQQSSTVIEENNSHLTPNFSPIRSPPGNINAKRQTISLSSDDDIVELIPATDCQRVSKRRSNKQINLNRRKRDE